MEIKQINNDELQLNPEQILDGYDRSRVRVRVRVEDRPRSGQGQGGLQQKGINKVYDDDLFICL